MVAGLLVLLLGAPETDAVKLLRVAYASQYEWKEDGVKNITLEFTYTWSWGPIGGGGTQRQGTGQIVVLGDRIVRRHYPDLQTESERAGFDEHIVWIVRRFVRRPFEAVFKDAKLEGPEETVFGSKIKVGPRAIYVKDDRFVAADVNGGTPQAPFWVLAQYETGPLSDGYAILGEACNYTRKKDGVKVSWSRKLTTQGDGKAPVPAAYTYTRKETNRNVKLTIQFDRVRIDSRHPVVLEPPARVLLKAAWERRFTLPRDIRIEGQWQRRIDRELDKAGWTGSGVRGIFQVWGMEKVEAALDEAWKQSWRGRSGTLEATCRDHIKGVFALLHPAPFDEVFARCGFELVPQGEDQIVQVYGYRKALAFKVSGGAIVGHYSRLAGENGWWSYRVKPTGDKRFLLERMKREIQGRKIELQFKYARVKGLLVPKKMDVLGVDWRDPRRGTVYGVAEYSFRKLKISLPKKEG
ncbi:MAG: hypothetical protein ACYTEZ_08520 [Planctomycetota bacterium]|jgi:hypothetical protein